MIRSRVAALVLICTSTILSTSRGQDIVTAFFVPGQPTHWNVLFDEYLTHEVGMKLNPPRNFTSIPARYPGQPSFDALLQTGKVDFVYVPAVLLVCFGAQYDAAPLVSATTRSGHAKLGGVILARKDDTRFRSFADIEGKVVGCAQMIALTSWALQSQRFAQEGVHVLSAAKQVVFYSSGLSVVKGLPALRDGVLDLLFVQHTTVRSEDFQVLWEMEADKGFDDVVSTTTIPNWGVASTPRAPGEIKFLVEQALLRMNASDPMFKQLNIGGFIPALSYSGTRNTMERQNLLQWQDELQGMRCYDKPTDMFEIIKCAPGSFRRPAEKIASGCAEQNLSCPEGAVCVCSPCIFTDFVVEVFPIATGKQCIRSEVCGETEQQHPLEYRVIDYQLRENASVTFELLLFTSDNIFTPVVGKAVRDDSDPFAYTFSITIADPGLFVLQLSVNGQQVDSSPFYVQVDHTPCEHGRVREPGVEGECVCGGSSLDINGHCAALGWVLLAVGLPALVLVALVMALYLRHRMKRADGLWLIEPASLHFDDPPLVLGVGTHGEVLKATYLGTAVAVKRMRRETVELETTNSFLHSADPPGLRLSGSGSAGTSQWLRRRLVGLSSMQQMGSVRRCSTAVNEGTSPSGGESRPSCHILAQSESTFLRRASSGMTVTSTSMSASSAQHKALAEMVGTASMSLPGGGSDETRSWWCCFAETCNARKNRKNFVKEMHFISRLRHPRITTVMGAVLKGENSMMVMEMMEYGSLQDLYLNEMIDFDSEMAHTIFLDITAGMDFLHSNKPAICHGDLKAGNILIDNHFRAKVSDFGTATETKRGVGTPFWMAPEVLVGGKSTRESDVYAFAITIVEVMVRGMPYKQVNTNALSILMRVVDPRIKLRPEIPGGCGHVLRSLMTSCWEAQPADRPKMGVIRQTLLSTDLNEYAGLWEGKRRKFDKNKDGIVYSLFPMHVADAMMRGEKPPEDHRECSTVFFSDIVGFTKLSSTMESHEVSDMLDRLFNQFDEIAAQHGVYKLETIGDCYIAVTNLVIDQDKDHVARMANFSLGVMQAASSTLIDLKDPSKGSVSIRAGFDSGPVVGSVVGTRNKKYTVFGNTVNTASRMESTSIPGRIQCTKRAADLLMEQDTRMILEPRGEINIKGRGTMMTFFVGRHFPPRGNLSPVKEFRDATAEGQNAGGPATPGESISGAGGGVWGEDILDSAAVGTDLHNDNGDAESGSTEAKLIQEALDAGKQLNDPHASTIIVEHMQPVTWIQPDIEMGIAECE